MVKISFDIKSYDAIFSAKNQEEIPLELRQYCKTFNLEGIAPLERRRLSNGAKSVMSLIDSSKIPIIFSSYKGEINRCFALLEMLAKEKIVSPTSFSLSVLNAIPALCSIYHKNQSEILSIASQASLEYGVLNAVLKLQSNPAIKECFVLSYYEGEGAEYYYHNSICSLVLLKIALGDSVVLSLQESLGKENLTNHSDWNFLLQYEKNNLWEYDDGKNLWQWQKQKRQYNENF